MARGRLTGSKPIVKSEGWWDKAYESNPDMVVKYELEFGKDVIKPGNPIKIKNHREVYKFRCLAHHVRLDSTWIDCISPDGQWRSFRIEQLKGLVKPKRSRRKKAQV